MRMQALGTPATMEHLTALARKVGGAPICLNRDGAGMRKFPKSG